MHRREGYTLGILAMHLGRYLSPGGGGGGVGGGSLHAAWSILGVILCCRPPTLCLRPASLYPGSPLQPRTFLELGSLRYIT